MGKAPAIVFTIVIVGALATPIHADTFAQIKQRGTLRWGGDKTGGAPYIYERDGKLQGFEVELADYLAGALGLRPGFIQGDWPTLPARLTRRDLDIVLNGYEWMPQREHEWSSTIPYFVYRIQLIARKDDGSIQSWVDLRAKPGRKKLRVGVLESSGAARYLQQNFGDDVQIEAYRQGVTSAMDSVQKGQLDATVQDAPAARHYLAREFPTLRPVGEPIAPGYFVIFVRHADNELREKLNQAIRTGLENGTLQRIYERYGIWNADQAELIRRAERWPPQPAAGDDGNSEISYFAWLLTRAAGTTVLLACLSMPLAIMIGLLVAVGRLYGPGWLGKLLVAYVEFLRGTPLLLQLYVIYFLLPDIGIYLPPFWAGILGLAINYSAYESENYRAGLLAVPRGQMEAALALGMSRWTALRHVIVPQAIRIVVPPVTNDFIALFKDTSVCSVIAVTELTGKFNELYNDHPSLVLQLGLVTSLLYLLMSYPLSLFARRLEHRSHKVVL